MMNVARRKAWKLIGITSIGSHEPLMTNHHNSRASLYNREIIVVYVVNENFRPKA